MKATASAEAKLKELKEERGELEAKLSSEQETRKRIASDILLLDRKSDSYAEDATKLKAELKEASDNIAEWTAELSELDQQIATAEEAVGYISVDMDPDDTGANDGDGSKAKGSSDVVPTIADYEFRGKRFGQKKRFRKGTKIRVAARDEKPEQGQEYDADLLAHPQYEQLFIDYMRYAGREGKGCMSFSTFAHNKASSYNQLNTELIGIPLFPMRLINLFECQTEAEVFVRRLATVHTVTDASSLEIWKRSKDRVTSYSRGCICTEPPKSGLPGVNQKILQPQAWTQAAAICRRKLVATAIDPIELLFDDMTEERKIEQEFDFLYGDGQEGPLGFYSDTDVLANAHEFDADEFNGDGTFVDLPKSMLKLFLAHHQRLRRRQDNVWIMRDSVYGQLLLAATAGGGCCKNGINIEETEGQDGALVTYVTAPGVPRRPVYVIDDEIADKLPANHPAKDIAVAYGSLRSLHVADFLLGTQLESDVDIMKDEICWVIRGFNDAVMTCPGHMKLGKAPAGVVLALQGEKVTNAKLVAFRKEQQKVAAEYAPKS